MLKSIFEFFLDQPNEIQLKTKIKKIFSFVKKKCHQEDVVNQTKEEIAQGNV